MKGIVFPKYFVPQRCGVEDRSNYYHNFSHSRPESLMLFSLYYCQRLNLHGTREAVSAMNGGMIIIDYHGLSNNWIPSTKWYIGTRMESLGVRNGFGCTGNSNTLKTSTQVTQLTTEGTGWSTVGIATGFCADLNAYFNLKL